MNSGLYLKFRDNPILANGGSIEHAIPIPTKPDILLFEINRGNINPANSAIGIKYKAFIGSAHNCICFVGQSLLSGSPVNRLLKMINNLPIIYETINVVTITSNNGIYHGLCFLPLKL